MNVISDKLPKKTLKLLAVCLGGLVIFIFAGIVPLQLSIAQMDENIQRTGYKIEEQRDFAPIYKIFQDRIKKGEKKTSAELIIPKPEKLPREQVQNLTQVMRNVSIRAGMTTVSVNPELKTTDITNSVAVNHVVQGSFLSFRKYLLYLAQLPYYEKIDSIKIEETATGLEYTVRLRVVVA